MPGGSTGLLMWKVKLIGRGVGARVIEEFRLDTGLLRELLAHEKQVAQELGEWDAKPAHS